MATQDFPFIQGDIQDSKFPINLTFLPNYFNGKNAMVGTPGLTTKLDPSDDRPVRWMLVDKSKKYLYAVIGNNLYLVDKYWNYTVATSVLNSSIGRVWMKAGVSEVIISDGYDVYRVTRIGSTPTLTTITSSLVYNSSFIEFLDNYFVSGGVDTFFYQLSDTGDGSSWTATQLGTVEADPDELVGGIVDHRQLFLFKSNTGEIHYNADSTPFPFERYPDVFIEDGLGAASSLCKVDNTIFWLNQEFILKRLNGFTPQLSGPFLFHRLVQNMTTKNDAICFSYSQYGFKYLVIIFPTENKTYVLNVGTGFMHQWSSGTSEGRHRANCFEYFNGFNLVGDYENGKIYAIDTDVYTDANSTILRKYYSPNFYSGGNLLTFKELMLQFKFGIGIASGQGSDPAVEFRYSNNGMQTWSTTVYKRKLGKMGKTTHGCVLRQQGTDTNRIYEMVMSDPVEVVFTDLSVDIEVSNG